MPTTAAHTFLDGYRAAFVRRDADALLDCFTYPVHVTSVAGGDATVSIAASRDEWRPVLDYLLDAYAKLGVADAGVPELDVAEPLDGVAHARVHWQLRREDGSAVYDFTAVYTLARVDGALRVAAIAHDELPKLQAALAR
jgi:hypothetical protein